MGDEAFKIVDVSGSVLYSSERSSGRSLDVSPRRFLPPFLVDFSEAMNFKLKGFNTFKGFKDFSLAGQTGTCFGRIYMML